MHIIDASAEDRSVNIDRVNDVLKEIDAHNLPTLMVYNKIDLMDDGEARIERDQEGRPVAVWLSALTGAGVDLLLKAVSEFLPRKIIHKHIQLQPRHASLRAALYSHKAVLSESYDDHGGAKIEIQLPESDFFRLVKQSGLKLEDLDTI